MCFFQRCASLFALHGTIRDGYRGLQCRLCMYILGFVAFVLSQVKAHFLVLSFTFSSFGIFWNYLKLWNLWYILRNFLSLRNAFSYFLNFCYTFMYFLKSTLSRTYSSFSIHSCSFSTFAQFLCHLLAETLGRFVLIS